MKKNKKNGEMKWNNSLFSHSQITTAWLRLLIRERERERETRSLSSSSSSILSVSLSLSFKFQLIELIFVPLRCLPEEGPSWRSSSLGIAGENQLFFSFSFPILLLRLLPFLFNTQRIDSDRYFPNLRNFLLSVLGLWSGTDSLGL